MIEADSAVETKYLRGAELGLLDDAALLYNTGGLKASPLSELAPATVEVSLAAAAELIDRGADSVLLACTELSLVWRQFEEVPVPVFDAAQVVAETVVSRAGRRVRMRASRCGSGFDTLAEVR